MALEKRWIFVCLSVFIAYGSASTIWILYGSVYTTLTSIYWSFLFFSTGSPHFILVRYWYEEKSYVSFSRHQCLMLADSESEKTKWVVALNELHRILKKNKLPDRWLKNTIFLSGLQIRIHFSARIPVMWTQMHWIWIRIQNNGPIWIRIQGYVINLEKKKKKKIEKNYRYSLKNNLLLKLKLLENNGTRRTFYSFESLNGEFLS